ncbi:MAG: Enoyl-CoA hydratase [Massilia sp.]|jgi:enoyl-CoA hydratase/carnithine racemase|nr:Enoyl-CoA hydratase [Massilia sp.]
MTIGPPYENLAITTQDGLAVITLDRPGGRNAFSTTFYAELRSAVREAEVNTDAATIVINSAAEHFAVGGDLAQMMEYLRTDPPSWSLWDFRDSLPFEAIRACTKPTIAVIDGICCGGGFATAVCCDFILATPCSRFGTPETKVGLIDGLVGPALYGHVPLPLLKFMLFSGELIDADLAQRSGLVFELHETDRLMERATELHRMFSRNGSRILADYKRAFRGYELPVENEATMKVLYSDPATQDRVRAFFNR